MIFGEGEQFSKEDGGFKSRVKTLSVRATDWQMNWLFVYFSPPKGVGGPWKSHYSLLSLETYCFYWKILYYCHWIEYSLLLRMPDYWVTSPTFCVLFLAFSLNWEFGFKLGYVLSWKTSETEKSFPTFLQRTVYSLFRIQNINIVILPVLYMHK